MRAGKKIAGALYRAKMRLKGIPSLRGVSKRMKKKRALYKEAQGYVSGGGLASGFGKSRRMKTFGAYVRELQKANYRLGD